MKEVLASQIPFKNHHSLSLKAAEPIVTRLILSYIQRKKLTRSGANEKQVVTVPTSFLLP